MAISGIHVILMTSPPFLFHASTDDPGSLWVEYPLLLDISRIRADTGGGNATVSITLDNSTGEMTTLFADPPIMEQLLLMDGEEILFDGVVKSVSMADTCTLSAEA